MDDPEPSEEATARIIDVADWPDRAVYALLADLGLDRSRSDRLGPGARTTTS